MIHRHCDELDVRQLKKAEQSGKSMAKRKKQAKGRTNQELRKLQKQYADPSLALFPGTVR